MQVFIGILLHAIGASCAALCYVPQKRAPGWSWQTYWLAQAAICWLLLPVIGAVLSTPHLLTVLHEAPSSAMFRSFTLGMAYGIGGTAFGIAIRYVGFSLTYAISVGISCVLGTLLPPILNGQFGNILNGSGAGLIMTGIAAGAIGIAICGLAGRSKETDLTKLNGKSDSFSLAKGLPLCLLAGILSAVYGISIDQGHEIAVVAAKYGAGKFQGNVIYLFSNTGAFVTTLIYCIYLHVKKHSFGEYLRIPALVPANRTGGVVGVASQHNTAPLDEGAIPEVVPIPANSRQGSIRFYFAMSAITGLLWYSQFFFYYLGHLGMGSYDFTSWAIHMIMLVLFSTLTGLVMKEWISCRRKTINLLVLALSVLVLAVVMLTYGNYLGSG